MGSAKLGLTQAHSDVLGFESLSSWSLTQGSKALSSAHTQGQKSFSLSVGGWVELETIPLPRLGQVADKFYLDVQLPSQQTDPWWYGAVQLYVTIPSKNLWNQYVGQAELTGQPLGKFVPLEFAIPAALQQALNGSYSDLKLKVALNLPHGNGPYLLDNLRLQPTTPEQQPGETATCHPYVTVGANGDVRYQLTTPGDAEVQLFVRKDAATSDFLNQTLPPSRNVLPSGGVVHTYVDSRQNYAQGEALHVRFEVRETGCAGASSPAWTAGTSYTAGSKVSYLGKVYECRSDHTAQADQEPATTPTLWQVPNGCGFPAWVAGTQYQVGSRVSHRASSYEAVQAHTSQLNSEPQSTPSFWKVVDDFVLKPGPLVTDWAPAYVYGTAQSCRPYSDRDGDGCADEVDECADNPGKCKRGFCGCNELDTNGDGDAVPDCRDECPTDPVKVTKGDCGCAGSYAPAGTLCDDGPVAGVHTCDGAGVCGPELRPEIAKGLVQTLSSDDRTYVLVKADKASWTEAEQKAPAGYELVRIDSARENQIVTNLLSTVGAGETLWLGGKVLQRGVVAHIGEDGSVSDVFWNEVSSPKNIHFQYTNWASGQPGNASDGCVFLDTEGKWHLGPCGSSRVVVYERSALSLSVPPLMDGVTCDDFPGLVCQSNADPDSKPCDPEPAENPACLQCVQQQASDPNGSQDPYFCANVCPDLDCEKCLEECGAPCEVDQTPCAARCPDLAKLQPNCPEGEFGAACTVIAGPQRKECKKDSDCAGLKDGQGNPLVCGLWTDCTCPDSGPCQQCKEQESDGTCKVPCQTEFLCGSPRAGEACGFGAPDPLRCVTEHWCSDPNAESHPEPTAAGMSQLIEPAAIVPSEGLRHENIATGDNSQFPEDPPAGGGDPKQHPWCHYRVPGLQPEGVVDNKAGEAGRGKALAFSIDPDVTLNYELEPLPRGQIKFNLDASASLTAAAKFNIGGISGSVDILDATLAAHADRCGYSTLDSKVQLFGYDFLPGLIQRGNVPGILKQANTIPGCEDALEAYEEVVNRTKKAMKDAQELLRQYHLAAKDGACLSPGDLCRQVFEGAPGGFPTLDCDDVNLKVEDVINTFIFNYHRLAFPNVEAPTFAGAGLRLPNVEGVLRDWRLPNLTWPEGEGFDRSAFNFKDFGKLNPLPTLADSVGALEGLTLGKVGADTGALDPAWVDLHGCRGAEGEPKTLFAQPFPLGPIPMLLEVQSVVKYGLGGKFGFDFDTSSLTQLVTGGDGSAKDIATLQVKATPCVSAGLALFVGTGFSGFGFRASAGVEGIVNLGTLSAPAHATAIISMAAEDERIDLSPRTAPTNLKNGIKAGREIADELKGLWDEGKLPIPQRRFHVGVKYKYGLKLKADEILAGHLQASLQIKFWLWRKRWSKYLVNFGKGTALPERVLLGRNGTVFETSVPIPWGVVQMPSPFVPFRYLDPLDPDLIGAGGDAVLNRFPNLTVGVAELGNLGWSLDKLGAIELTLPQLQALGTSLGYKDLGAELIAKGINLDALTFADFAALGWTLDDFWPVQLELSHLAQLGVTLDQLSALGIELPLLSLENLDLSGLSLAHLGKLGLPADRLSLIQVDWRDLPDLNWILREPDLEEKLLAQGVDLTSVRLPDFEKIGIPLSRLRGWPLTPAHVSALSLTTGELGQLGIDLSAINLSMDITLEALQQRGIDLRGFSLANLGELGYTLADLSLVRVPKENLPELSLELGFPDLRTALSDVGVEDLNHVTLSDLGKLGIGIGELESAPGFDLELNLNDLNDQGLAITVSDLLKLGKGSEISAFDFDATCKVATLDTTRVGKFYYDRQCAECTPRFDLAQFNDHENPATAKVKPLRTGEQACSSDLDCCAGLKCVRSGVAGYSVCSSCTGTDPSCSTTTETVVTQIPNNNAPVVCKAEWDPQLGQFVTACNPRSLETTISQSFAGNIVDWQVVLEHDSGVLGTVDDKGFVIHPGPNGPSPLQVTGEPACGRSQIGTLIDGIDISDWVKRDGSTLSFKLRAADVCGTNVGYNNIRVRWIVTRGT